jgi:hypothetical protein
MTEINHFDFFAFFCSDVAMIVQPIWIARMSRELIEADSYIIVEGMYV